MLSKKSVYRVVSLLSIISLLAVAAIAIDSKQSGISPAFGNNVKETVELHISESVVSGETVPVNTQNKPENMMFAGGLDPNMLKEQEKAEVYTIDLRTGRHDEYLRVVLEGAHEIISKGVVIHNNNEVVVNFSDLNFSVIKKTLLVPFRREKNKLIFTKNSLESIRIHKLSKPSRLAIDLYTNKPDSDGQKAANMEEKKEVIPAAVNTIKTAVEDKTQPVTSSPEVEEIIHDAEKEKITAQSKTTENSGVNEDKTEPDMKANQVIKAESPVALIIPDASGVDMKTGPEEKITQEEDEEFQTISKKKVQKLVNKKEADHVEKALTPVTATAPAGLMVSNMPELKGAPEQTIEELDSSSNDEKISAVTKNTEINVFDHKDKGYHAEAFSPDASETYNETLSAPTEETSARPLEYAESDKAHLVNDSEDSNEKEERDSVYEATVPPVVSAKPPVESLDSQSPDVRGSTEQSPEKQGSESKGALIVVAGAERTLENSGPDIIADVKKETVPVEMNDAKDNVDVQSVREVTATDVQTEKVKRKIALLPFDNFSNNNDALDKVMPLIMDQLENMGHDVLDYEEVDAYLCERRIRQSSFISKEIAAELGNDKMVNLVMAGAVLTFSSGENPKIGILARLLDIATGNIIWSDFVSLTGEDFTKVLGLGTITSIDLLVPRALDRLFVNIGKVSPKPGNNDLYKIAVLPFKNESKHRHAGMIITHLFQNELANNPMFDPVDFGDIRQNIIKLRIGRKGEVDYNSLQALSKSLGVDAVLTGTVEEYRSGQAYSSPPRVTISARLLDSTRNRILWYENLQLDGEENIIALDWGRLRTADRVAYGAVSGLVKNIKTEGLHQ